MKASKKIHSRRMNRCSLALLSLSLALTLQGCNTKALTGGVEVKNRTAAGTPPARADIIHVCDFHLDPSLIKVDPTGQGLAGGLLGGASGSGGSGGILSRLRQRSQPEIHGTPEEQARQMVNQLAEDTTKALNKLHLTADRAGACPDNMASGGWVVRGDFRGVDEGNRAERAAIGFGEGATHMDLSVKIQDLSKGADAKPVEVFDTQKDPGKKPGAVVSMNPYVFAAKFHMEKNATSKDVEQTAEEIAQEIARLSGIKTKD